MTRMLRDSRVASWYLALAAITSAVSCAAEVSDPLTEEQANSVEPYDAELDDAAVGVATMKLTTAQCTRAGHATGPGGEYSVPVDANGSQRCWMERGNVGPAVEALQRALHYCFLRTDIVPDGEYGPKTQGAVRWLQGELRIAVDGVYGPETRAHMGDGFAYEYIDACASPLP